METLVFTFGLLILTVLAVNSTLRVIFDSSLFATYRQTLADIRVARQANPEVSPVTPQEIAEADVVVVTPRGWRRTLGVCPDLLLSLLACEYCLSHWVTFAYFGFFVGPAVFSLLAQQTWLAYAFGTVPAVFACIELRRLLNAESKRRFST